MKIKKLVKVNLINAAILGLIVVFKLVTGILLDPHNLTPDSKDWTLYILSIVFTIVFLTGWAAYTIYSNLSVIKEDDEEEKRRLAGIRNRISKAGNLKFFVNERKHLVNMWDSIQSREKYFLSEDRDERVRSLYILTRNQMMRNLTDASDYLESFDYISGRDSGYLKGVCDASQTLLDKFNKMVELSVSVDDETLSYDTREIDDMIEALEIMKKSGKNRLEI